MSERPRAVSGVAMPPRELPGAGVLVVDDEKTLRFTLTEALRDQGFRAYEAANGGEAATQLRTQNIDVVLLDFMLKESGEDGLVLLKGIRRDFPEVEVVMLTAHASYDLAVRAIKAGCYHFMAKPFQNDQVRIVVQAALENARLRREVEVLRRERSSRFPLDQVIGEAEGLREVLETVKRVAPSRATVLLYGETGTGKEILARAVHRFSDTPEGPFVAVNCSAVPENLLESELFGYEKGAFTDATARKKGMFELAHGGTLFLDEIGDMAGGLQAKLLRVLETGTFKRLGGTGDIEVRVRVVAATNRDLKAEVAARKFREDLYYRLAVVPVHIPPLRERRADVPLLVAFFLDHFNREMGRSIRGLTPETERAILAYSWPGNVRELRNVIERAVLLGSGDWIEPAVLPREVLHPVPAGPPLPAVSPRGFWTLAEAERHAIEGALRSFDGNKTRAAEALGISRQTLRSKIREYGLTDFAGGDSDP